MGRTSRKSSEDYSSTKKRTTRSRDTSSPRRGSADKTRKRDEKRDDKRDERKQTHDLRNHRVEKSKSKSQEKEVQINGHNLPKEVLQIGSFENYPEITPKTVESLKKRGINFLFPVQYESFNSVLKREDLIVRDLTGSGKTLGFGLPMVEYLRKNKYFGSGKIQGVILAPTRELALQVSKEINLLKHYDNEYNVLTVYGGVSIDDQTRELRRGVDIFVGTTGRVLDHMDRGNFNFTNLKFIILDEADQMLKLGFKEDVERIMGTIKEKGPKDVQVLLFSATVPRWVKTVAEQYLKPNFRTIDLAINLKNKTSKTVNHLAINCPYTNRIAALADILVCYGGVGQTIVFCSTKQEANSLLLSDKIKKDIEVMHGDIAQNQREVTLKRFKENKFSVLVATDVASRGLDIPNVDLVIQVEPPKDTETYIHRSGRTARAGKVGTCITFYSKKHVPLINQIEFKAGIKFQKIGVPQPEDVIKASSKYVLKNLVEVNKEVLPLFEEAAQQLIDQHNGNAKEALCKTLAYLSGNYKNVLGARSLLTGQEQYVTFEIKLKTAFYGISFVWNILRKYIPEAMTEQIRGMRCFKNMDGVVFDVPEDILDRFEDIFTHLKEEKRIDFEIGRAKALPELKEDESQVLASNAYGRGGYGGGRGGYGGESYGNSSYGTRNAGYQQRGGYGNRDNAGGQSSGYAGGQSSGYAGGQSNGYNGGQSSGYAGGSNRSNDEATAFVGNLPYNVQDRDIEDFFKRERLSVKKIRMIKDQDGNSKGVAFVEFSGAEDVEKASKLNGSSFGSGGRPLRINPANSKPTGR